MGETVRQKGLFMRLWDMLWREKSNLSLKVTLVVEPDDGGFHAYAPALKGLHVDGKTEEEAVENGKRAIMVYLNSLSYYDDPLPIGPDLSLHEELPEIPKGALLHYITLRWPSLQTSGIS